MPDYKKLVRKKAYPRKSDFKKSRSKKIIGKIILLLILVLPIAACIFAGRSLFVKFSYFKIKEVSIVDRKGKLVANPQNYFRLNADAELNLLSFDMKRQARDIRARHPELADVFIRKQFPNRLLIVLKERIPVAIIVYGQNSYLVDGEGFILPFNSIYINLPKIIGIPPRLLKPYTKTDSLVIKKALSLLEELVKANVYPEYKVSEIDVRRYSDITFQLENGIEVKMGEGEFRRKAALLSKILAQLKQDRTVPKYIDMRFDSPVVKP